jgi:hypothetical protein
MVMPSICVWGPISSNLAESYTSTAPSDQQVSAGEVVRFGPRTGGPILVDKQDIIRLSQTLLLVAPPLRQQFSGADASRVRRK